MNTDGPHAKNSLGAAPSTIEVDTSLHYSRNCSIRLIRA